MDMLINYGGRKKYKWKTLEHNGVLFPPEYVEHNTPILYNGQEVQLGGRAEEYATLYAKYLETPYIDNKTFNKNFWNDWKKVLPSGSIIKSLEQCDFSPIYQYILKQKEIDKDKKKKASSENIDKYKTALVDGIEQPVGNFRVEPPGIFIGRGCNPKLGKIKKRIQPEDITINIGKNTTIPQPPEGHQWGVVQHDRTVEWLASWKEAITNKIKYVWLGGHSNFKRDSDIKKFNLARKLKRKISDIREQNSKLLSSNNLFMKQLATALYFIDEFALRVGNEKGEDETDTVGIISLRVEHIKILDNNKLELDFMGKDYIRYKRTVIVEPVVYKNIYQFIKDKKYDEQLFDQITASDMNRYLRNYMSGLTAKVFRTYNASNLFQREISKINKKIKNKNLDVTDKINFLLNEYNSANAKVALLCNHQKTVNKTATNQINKIDENIKKNKNLLRRLKRDPKKYKIRIQKVNKKLKTLRAKKKLKLEIKNLALGTSKINYIDPRISIAFIKTHDIPIDKIFSKTLQQKFNWAIDTKTTFRF